MSYIPHTEADLQRMLRDIGVGSVEELLRDVPPDVRVKEPLDLPHPLSEQGLLSLLRQISSENSTAGDYATFLGAGAYNHYIPSPVRHIVGRSEFYTSYTPYQPEISQGILQSIFEYQTLICQLTAMDVANASLYDGASAVAEAVIMAGRITGRKRVVLSSAIHPEYRQTVRTYLRGGDKEIVEVFYCTEKGTTLADAVERVCGDEPACLVVQSPNFFGCIEDLASLAEVIHSRGGLFVVVVSEPLSLAILKPPGECGADIAVGEGQSFGNPLNFGGPYLGFMATRSEFVRQMPGRLVGRTTDRDGKTRYCLTLATREQHIRRDRATSNICTNEGLCALTAVVYLACLGRRGLRKLARINLSKAEYLKERLISTDILEPGFTSPTFNEFTMKVKKVTPERLLSVLLDKGIIGGLALRRFYPELKDHILVSVTEMNSREDMERYATGVLQAV